MSTPNKQYKVFNIAETNPTGVPDSGFVWLYPRDAAIWVRLPDGTEYQLLKLSQTGSGSIPVWTTSTDNIQIGDYFLYDDFLYRALAPSSSSDPKQPDLFPTFWESVDLSDLAHAQNTDFKLGTFYAPAEPVSEILLYSSTFNKKNFIQIGGDGQDQWDSDIDITLKSYDSATGVGVDHYYFIRAFNDGQVGRAVFTTNAFQDVGDGLILSDEDWAIFKGNVDGITKLVTSNKVGDFIPLSGTVEGKPVTGIVKFQSSGGGVIEINIAEYEGAIELKSNDGVRVANIGSSALNYSGEYFSGESQLPFSNTFIFSQQTGFLLSSNHDDSKGLLADKYYGANYDDNTYVQKKYIVNEIIDNSIDQDSFDLTGNTELRTGTGTVAISGDNSILTVDEATTLDDYAGDAVILTFSALTNYNPIPKQAFYIIERTGPDTLLLQGNCILTGACDYRIVTPYQVPGDRFFLLGHKPGSGDQVFYLPEITALNDRFNFETYWEEGFGSAGDRVFGIMYPGQKIKDKGCFELVAENESFYGRYHFTGVPHLDPLQLTWFNVILDVNISTPLAAAVSTGSTWQPVPALAWDTNTPIRFYSIEVDDTVIASAKNITNTYNSSLRRSFQINGYIECERPAGGDREIRLRIETWNGSAWVSVANSERSMILTASGSRNDLNVSCRCADVEFGTQYRLAWWTNDTVLPLQGGINMIKTQ
jgi:hypothetical protein